MVSLYFYMAVLDSWLWGDKEKGSTDLAQCPDFKSNSCVRVATWASTRQMVGEGEEIGILCDWTLASTKRREN